MKANTQRLSLLLLFIWVGASAQDSDLLPAGYIPEVHAFYDALAPYGEWISIEEATVWRPLHVRDGWRPYSMGRWVWTDFGWYWVSAEPFGWAVFHYGRWARDNYYGWIWVPDRTWGPGWVDWRYNDDFIGWAPLPPPRLHISFSVYSGMNWTAPWHHWNFIRCTEFGTMYRYREYVPGPYVRRIIGATRHAVGHQYLNGRVFNNGVDRSFVDRRTRERIETAEVRESPDPRNHGESLIRTGGSSSIEISRPNFERRPTRLQNIQRGHRGFSWNETPNQGQSNGGEGRNIPSNAEPAQEVRTPRRGDGTSNSQPIQNPTDRRLENRQEQPPRPRREIRREIRGIEQKPGLERGRPSEAPIVRNTPQATQQRVPDQRNNQPGIERRRR